MTLCQLQTEVGPPGVGQELLGFLIPQQTVSSSGVLGGLGVGGWSQGSQVVGCPVGHC